MTALVLQELLLNEVKEILQKYKLKNEKGEEVNINIYPQSLPAKKNQKDVKHFPYVVAKVMDGSTEEEESRCKIDFIIGVYDEDDNYQGYKDVMNIIEKIKQHLFEKRFFKCFRIDFPFNWVVYEEDTYPFYFGGIETSWIVPTTVQILERGGVDGATY